MGLEKDYSTFSSQSKDKDGYERFLRELLARRIGKDVCASFIRFSFHSFDGMEVCLVEVGESSKPVFAMDDDGPKMQRFYVRMANGTVEFAAKETLDYATTRWPK